MCDDAAAAFAPPPLEPRVRDAQVRGVEANRAARATQLQPDRHLAAEAGAALGVHLHVEIDARRPDGRVEAVGGSLAAAPGYHFSPKGLTSTSKLKAERSWVAR